MTRKISAKKTSKRLTNATAVTAAVMAVAGEEAVDAAEAAVVTRAQPAATELMMEAVARGEEVQLLVLGELRVRRRVVVGG